MAESSAVRMRLPSTDRGRRHRANQDGRLVAVELIHGDVWLLETALIDPGRIYAGRSHHAQKEQLPRTLENGHVYFIRRR